MAPVIKWGEFSVNSIKDGTQEGIQLQAFSNGQFMAVWEHHSTLEDGTSVDAIYAQRFYSGAAAAGDPIQISTSAGVHGKPTMTVLSDGRILFVWQSTDPTSAMPNKILGRIFKANGTPEDANADGMADDDFVITSSTLALSTPKVIAAPDGGFAVSFTHGTGPGTPGTDSGADLNTVFFNGTGTSYGGIQSILASDAQQNTSLIALDGNVFMSFYMDQYISSGAPEEIRAFKANLYRADGTSVVDLGTIKLVSTVAKDTIPSVTTLADGRFVITWTQPSAIGSGYDVMTQVFRPSNDGFISDGDPITVSNLAGDQTSPSVTMLRQGGFAISYLDFREPGAPRVVVAVYDENNAQVGTHTIASDRVVEGARTAPVLVELLDGRLVAAWNENLTTSVDDPIGIRGQVIDARFKGISLPGTAEHDQYVGSAFGDTLKGGAAGNDHLSGVEGNDRLYGESGSDTLDGGIGIDIMIGGTGNDTYYVDNVSDKVVELSTGGTADLVHSTISYTLAAYVENLTASGVNAITLTGNTLNNRITGNAAANKLYGGAGNDALNGAAGADIMTGGTGNDTYYVDNTGDRVVETSTGGTADRVVTAISYTLGSYVENLAASGTAAVRLTGNTLKNVIAGNSASNIINGGAGSDTMIGGAGNDTYYVASTGDRVVETSTGGTADRVVTTISYKLGYYVEQLIAIGSGAVTLTGNSLSNMIIGNAAANKLYGGAGNDVLNGAAGADIMTGGSGNDTYYVASTGDRVIETSTGGTADKVVTTISYTLGSYVEQLSALGTAAIALNGNTLKNVIRGNSGANKINGGLGNDTLYGGSGQDTFVFNTKLSSSNVDTIGDFVVAYDKIQLDSAIITKLGTATGTLNLEFFTTGTAAKDANDYIINNNGYLYYDQDGSGSGVAILFAKFNVGNFLSFSDFEVI